MTRELVLTVVDRLPGHDDARRLAIRALADPLGRGTVVLDQVPGVASDLEEDDEAVLSLGAALTVIPDFERALALLERGLKGLRTRGRMGLVTLGLMSVGDAALYCGDWSLALRASDERVRLADETDQPIWKSTAYITQATVAGMRGDEDRATGLLDEAEETLAPLGLASSFCHIQVARAAIAIGAGHHTEAFRSIQRGVDPSDVAYSPLYASRGLVDLAGAAIRTEHRAEARRIVGKLEQMAAMGRSPFIEVSLGCVRPMLADDDNAEALYGMAVGNLRPKMTFLRARVQLSCGAWLRRRGRVADSRIPLRAARQRLDALGAVPWGARARQELRASGETSRRRLPDGRDDLTPESSR